MKIKIALFDFDKTIIDQDSIYLLYQKTIQEHKEFRSKLYSNNLKHLLKIPFNKNWKKSIKNEFLKMLSLYSTDEIREFVYKDLLKDHVFLDAKEEIKKLKKEGYHLLLVSASAEYYLKYVADILPFDYYIGTKIDENFNIMGENNKHQVKVKNIMDYLAKNNWEIDYEESLAYSDSLSADGPMLELVKNKYLINTQTAPKGYKILNWK